MQHFSEKFDFNLDITPFSWRNYSLELLKPGNITSLLKFLRSFHSHDWDFGTICRNFERYQRVTEDAIKSQNIEALEAIWQAIYYHDQNNPSYDLDLTCAVEFGSLQMVQHCLWAYMNYATLDDLPTLQTSYLLELSEKNGRERVQEYMKKLALCFPSEVKPVLYRKNPELYETLNS